jgi:hypothetical protein
MCKSECDGYQNKECNTKCKNCIECSEKCILLKVLLSSWKNGYELCNLDVSSINVYNKVSLSSLCIDRIKWYIKDMNSEKSNIKWNICDDCCQLKSARVSCVCEGGIASSKKINMVSGCSVYISSIRCKNAIGENGVCVLCYNRGTSSKSGKVMMNILKNNDSELKKKGK